MNMYASASLASELEPRERHVVELRARRLREAQAEFAGWAEGYGVIRHDPLTQVRVHAWVEEQRAAAGE